MFLTFLKIFVTLYVFNVFYYYLTIFTSMPEPEPNLLDYNVDATKSETACVSFSGIFFTVYSKACYLTSYSIFSSGKS